MTAISLANPAVFQITDPQTQAIAYGCDQGWYPARWQQMSGCGPSVASTLLFYYSRTRPGFGLAPVAPTKDGLLSLMLDVWKYVTPTPFGIPLTWFFYRGVQRLAKAYDLKLTHQVYNLPILKSSRPPLADVLRFIETALKQDYPVAFLNLNNGELTNLEKWHWVTLIGLEYDDRNAHATVLDQGHLKSIDLRLWYATTSLGGGFVYFIV